jgi:hypothetical protein
VRFTLWWWISCARRGPEALPELEESLRIADAAWEGRGEAGFGLVEEILAEASRLAPGDPEVAWRLVRLRVAQGLAAEEQVSARDSFGRARELGMACLDGDLLFAQRRVAVGWEQALRRMPPDRAPCAAWLGMAWVRWISALGPEAAAVDLEAVRPLLDAAEGKGQGDLAGWARGVLDGLLPPEAGGRPEQALEALEAAAVRSPGSLVRWADLATIGLRGPERDSRRSQIWEQICARPAQTPEERMILRACPGGDQPSAR